MPIDAMMLRRLILRCHCAPLLLPAALLPDTAITPIAHDAALRRAQAQRCRRALHQHQRLCASVRRRTRYAALRFYEAAVSTQRLPRACAIDDMRAAMRASCARAARAAAAAMRGSSARAILPRVSAHVAARAAEVECATAALRCW